MHSCNVSAAWGGPAAWFACPQAAVDRLLTAPPPGASAEALQHHLKLLVEAYKRTHTLAEQLQASARWGLTPSHLLRAVVPDRASW